MAPQVVVQPMEPAYLVKFLTKEKIDAKTIECFVKAITKYNEACIKASKQLTEDLGKCQKPFVKAKKPASKK